MSDIEVSVIVPARNAARYLGEAVASIHGQTRPPLETIIVDDGSVDGTAALARSFGEDVRVVSRKPGLGSIGASRRLGVRSARGSALAFLDADDRWEPEWLEIGAAALSSEPAPDLVFGRVREFVSPDLCPEEAARLRPLPGCAPAYTLCGMMLRRQTYDRVGDFDPRRAGAEFTDWFIRAREAGLREVVLDAVTLNRRLHSANTTRLQRPEVMRHHAIAIKAALDRRRARGQL